MTSGSILRFQATWTSPPINKARETEFSSYCNRHISTASGSKSSPRKIYYRNSPGARTPTSNSAWTTKEKTSTRNRGAEGTSLSGPFSLSTVKAMPTTRDRGTGDWNQKHYDRFILSKKQTDFWVCRFPRRYIDQSLFHLTVYYGPGNNNFQANFVLCFCLFLNPGRRNNAKSAFQYTVNNNTT